MVSTLGYGPEAMELVGIPDPETFCQLPWDKRVARVFCVCFRNREERENAGAHLTSDCRGNLKRHYAEFKDKYDLNFRVGTEPEMMWLKRGEDGMPDGGFSKPNCYHIDQFESLRPVFMQVIEYCNAMGLDMIQGDHEDAPGQLELNWMFDDVVRNCDRLATYRQICAQVARENNLIACFMTKPFMGVSASGCHYNISLWRGGEDHINTLHNDPVAGMDDCFTYMQGGENTFMPDTDDPQLPGKIGLQCVGGIVTHLGALTAIGCSTVNSYRRLWDTGYWAPVFADWGFQNRTTGLRISAPGRFEYRAVDSMVNPYLMGSALLKAFEDGMDNDIDPGEPENRNIYQAMEAGKASNDYRCRSETLWNASQTTRSLNPPCPMKCIKFSIGTRTMNGKIHGYCDGLGSRNLHRLFAIRSTLKCAVSQVSFIVERPTISVKK